MSRPTQFYPPVSQRRQFLEENSRASTHYLHYGFCFAYCIIVAAFFSNRMTEILSLLVIIVDITITITVIVIIYQQYPIVNHIFAIVNYILAIIVNHIFIIIIIIIIIIVIIVIFSIIIMIFCYYLCYDL